MRIAGDLDYAHARLCARFGERPDELAWRAIEPIRSLPALLDAARSSPFRRWIEGITASASAHAIEAALVSRRRALVAEVARWMPMAWMPAIEWAGVLADLPILDHIARGREVLPWMRRDRLYEAVCGEGVRPPASGPFLPLAAGWRRPDGLFAAWRDEWVRRAPRASVDPKFLELARALASQRFGAGMSSAGTARRGNLAARLTILFRRAAGEPAAAFIFLALSALDLERLRGELLRRAVFPTFGLAA